MDKYSNPKFESISLVMRIKGKRKCIIDNLSYDFNLSQHQIWCTENKITLNILYHLITGNIYPTRGKVLNPILSYNVVKPVSTIFHFTLEKYIKTIFSIASIEKDKSKQVLQEFCRCLALTKIRLKELVEHISNTDISVITLSLAILLNKEVLFIDYHQAISIRTLLPEAMLKHWDSYLTKNAVIAMYCGLEDPELVTPFISKCDFKTIKLTDKQEIITTP